MTATLSQRVQEYLRLRRALGFRLQREGQVLPQFAAYLEQAGAATVTAGHAIAWAQLPQGVDPVTWTHRLTAVRSFAAWLRAIDPATEIPPRGVFPGQGKRPVPFIYSGSDITALISACGSLRPRTRAATYTALFGLVAVTGIRIGEALALPVAGIDLDAGLLSVRPAKSRCERILPLHPSTVEALAQYAALRDREHPAARTFFVSIRGTALCYSPVLQAFRQACAAAGLDGPGPRPRIHDLRHTFAVTTLLDWHRSGEDIAAQMPALSGYLGHISPEGTYWYISAVPELMHLAAARLTRKEDRDE
jgi:integrase